jgi:hypothetical protein
MWSPFVPHILTRVSKRQLPPLKASRRVVQLLLRDGNRQHLHFPLLSEGVTRSSYLILSTLWHPQVQSEGWGFTERFSLFCISEFAWGLVTKHTVRPSIHIHAYLHLHIRTVGCGFRTRLCGKVCTGINTLQITKRTCIYTQLPANELREGIV